MSTDIKMKLAKLSRQENGSYKWDGWTVVKAKCWVEGQGSRPCYEATHAKWGITFTSNTLKEVRAYLPYVDTAYHVDGTLLDNVQFTVAHIQKRYRERPNEEKLEAADREICRRLNGMMESGQQGYQKFMDAVNNDGLTGLPNLVRWSGSIMRMSFKAQRYNDILTAPSAKERMQVIVHTHQEYQNQMLTPRFHDVDGSNNLHRAVAKEEATAIAEVFGVLDSFIRTYHNEFVESDDLPQFV